VTVTRKPVWPQCIDRNEDDGRGTVRKRPGRHQDDEGEREEWKQSRQRTSSKFQDLDHIAMDLGAGAGNSIAGFKGAGKVILTRISSAPKTESTCAANVSRSRWNRSHVV
jgi:ABC-type polysaccharide/polyol phosphate transport system ATPase subunit